MIGGLDTVTNAHRLLRAKNYANAYKHTSIKEWNEYIVFGIQQFDSPAKYFAQCDAETPDKKNLCLARYYKLHLENNVQADQIRCRRLTLLNLLTWTEGTVLFPNMPLAVIKYEDKVVV